MKRVIPDGITLFMVPLTGLEPVQYRYRGILSPLCLPIPPQRRLHCMIAYYFFIVKVVFAVRGRRKIHGIFYFIRGHKGRNVL